MNRFYKYRAFLSLLLAVLLFVACSTAEPQTSTEPTPESTEAPAAEPAAESTQPPVDSTQEPALSLPEGAVEVHTVDELLSALAPNTTIVLKEGTYDLSTASDYGSEDVSGYYYWDLVLGGAQLNIFSLKGLRLIGQGQVSILARSRYAEVLSFLDCWDLSLEGLTLGHTQGSASCSGGVLNLYACDNVSLDNCRLYGCGVLGLSATNCESVVLRSCKIDNCSNAALFASVCGDIRMEECEIRECGLSKDGSGGDLFFLDRCKGFALINSEITENKVQRLLQNDWSDQVVILGCLVEQNIFLSTVFEFQGRSVTIDKCSFRLRSSESYYPKGSNLSALTPAGEKLTSADLDHMELGRAEYSGPVFEQEDIHLERTELPDGRFEVHVSTADELLAAIAPNTTILLEAGTYDLSSVSDYGGPGSDWYYWENDFDGFSLKLIGVQGLQIVGAGKDQTFVVTAPRYSAVFRFLDCYDLSIRGITAGHTEAPGACTGDVLDFDSCQNVTLEDCGLFGCGVLGIWAFDCYSFAVRNSEIYECSNGAAEFSGCMGLSFENCSIHDCDYNTVLLFASEMTWNGQLLSDGNHVFQGQEYLDGTPLD